MTLGRMVFCTYSVDVSVVNVHAKVDTREIIIFPDGVDIFQVSTI